VRKEAWMGETQSCLACDSKRAGANREVRQAIPNTHISGRWYESIVVFKSRVVFVFVNTDRVVYNVRLQKLHKCVRKLDVGHTRTGTAGLSRISHVVPWTFSTRPCSDVLERCACVGCAVVSLSLPPLLRLSVYVVQRWCEARILRTFSQRLPTNSLSFRFFWGITIDPPVLWMCFHLPTCNLEYVLILFACHSIYCMLNQKNRLHLTHWHQGSISLT